MFVDRKKKSRGCGRCSSCQPADDVVSVGHFSDVTSSVFVQPDLLPSAFALLLCFEVAMAAFLSYCRSACSSASVHPYDMNLSTFECRVAFFQTAS